jgi:hypothetical protein
MALDPRDTLAALERHVAELKAMPLAKCEELDPIEDARRKYHAAWVKALDVQVRQPGWSLRRVAEVFGVHVSMICKWRDHGWRKDSQIPAYGELRMPRLMRDTLAIELAAIVVNDNATREASNG